MTTRMVLAVLFFFFAVSLGFCAFYSSRSGKKLGSAVCRVLLPLIPLLVGNMLVVLSAEEIPAQLGYYLHLCGMAVFAFQMLSFTFEYCQISWPENGLNRWIRYLLIADAAQLLLNPVFGHAFATQVVEIEGKNYWKMVPFFGYTFHSLLCYGVFAAVLLIFLLKMMRAPRIYVERYAVIFAAMTVVGAWKIYCFFDGREMDQSVIGLGLFGLLLSYFSILYRPLRLLDGMLAEVASHKDEAYFFFDALERPIWANELGLQMTGTAEGEFDHLSERLRLIFGRIYLGKSNWKEQRVLDENGEKKYYLLEKQMMTDARNAVMGSFLIIRDQTEDQKQLRQEKYNATHDRLTGLYTKEYLFEEIYRMMSAHPGQKYLAIFADIYNFKIINDIYGTRFGDAALLQVAQTIRRSVQDLGVYGRISGDTFGICMPADCFRREDTENLLHRFTVEDGKISRQVLIHLGIYPAEEAEADVSKMFDRAKMALSGIKNEYNTVIAYYNTQMRDEALWDQYITNELPAAIENREIQPYLQPIVDEEGMPVGAEVLVRWRHPTQGMLMPWRFIPFFERNGMIAEVDRYMWRCACEILQQWKQAGISLFLSINVSPKDFYFMDVGKEIRDIVAEYQVNPQQLRIEITETVMMSDMENRIRILNDLKQDGFLIEMDDFGSGYSSLNMLKDMPIDLIKIDMMFLRQTRDNEKAKTILQNILHLSEELGMISLTEGVETENQYHMLAEKGCHLFQGFYFAKPMPPEEYEKYWREHHPPVA